MIAVHRPCPKGASTPRRISVSSSARRSMPSVETAALNAYPALSRAANPKPTDAPSTSPARSPRIRVCRRSTNISAASLHRLLDEPDPDEHPQRGMEQVVLHHRGAEHAQYATGQEAAEDHVHAQVAAVVLVRPQHEDDRDQEAAEQDQRRQQGGVPGRVRDERAERPEREPAPQAPPPQAGARSGGRRAGAAEGRGCGLGVRRAAGAGSRQVPRARKVRLGRFVRTLWQVVCYVPFWHMRACAPQGRGAVQHAAPGARAATGPHGPAGNIVLPAGRLAFGRER